MPPVARHVRSPDRTVVVPRRVADALRPAEDRRGIPSRVSLRTNAPPFDGEVREDQGRQVSLIAPGAEVVIVTLRRAWLYVGFAVDPGAAAAGAGIVAYLRVLSGGVNGKIGAGTAITAAGGPQAVAAIQLGARAELVVKNGTATALPLVRGTIWGMGE